MKPVCKQVYVEFKIFIQWTIKVIKTDNVGAQLLTWKDIYNKSEW